MEQQLVTGGNQFGEDLDIAGDPSDTDRDSFRREIRFPLDPASARFARWLIRMRATRFQFFNDHLFSDPAWDMLLELYALECEGRRISVSKLSVAAGVPCTTTLRWIDKLESESLIVRADDPFDARRVWIGLSERGVEAMRDYVDEVSAGGLPA